VGKNRAKKDFGPQNRIDKEKLVLTRPSDKHLDDAELDALVLQSLDQGPDAGWLTKSVITDLQGHVESCQACSLKVQIHKAAQSEIVHTGLLRSAAMGPDCVPNTEWLKVAAGLLTEAKTKELVKHAAQCGHCGPLLKNAAETLSDEVTPREETLLASLPSARPEWQKNMASTLHGNARNRQEKHSWRRALSIWPTPAYAFAGITAIAVVAWLGVRTLRPPSAEQLLAQAYTEHRTLEPRIAGAKYAPMRGERGVGDSNLDKSPALLKAEALIGENLRQHPNDPVWLQARARADLLDGNYDSAVKSLQRALESQSDSPSLLTDLGSAYFLRAESADRPTDYANAIESLGKALSKSPDDPIALFNRALACERMFLYSQAVDDWEHYLRVDPQGKWADEAHTRLAGIEERIREQKERSEKPLLTPQKLVAVFEGGKQRSIDEIDNRVEQYAEVAVTEWMPEIASAPPNAREADSQMRLAVDNVAKLLVSRHNDGWLAELLREAMKNHHAADDNIHLLAAALKASQGTDLDSARRLALKAARQFRREGSPVGEMRALFEGAYVDQLAHQAQRCEAEANKLTTGRRTRLYAWLQIQAMLEAATCASMSDESARTLTKQALELATLHHYPNLQLRAKMLLSAFCDIMGDSTIAWKYSSDGLLQYWTGDHPSMRGYSFYAGLDEIAEERGQWFLDIALIREGIGMISHDSDTVLRAMEQQRLAQTLFVTGDLQGAETNFEIAQQLFHQSAIGERRNNLEAESQIGLANIEVVRAEPQQAVTRLENVRSRVDRIPDKDISLDFFRTLGLAYLQSGDHERAEQNLATALRLAEEALRLNTNERERLIWSRKTESIYRAMVRLKLPANPEEAFSRWEWYKSASLRGNRPELGGAQPVEISLGSENSSGPQVISSDTALVAYAIFADGVAAWVYDEGGVRQRWIDTPRVEIEDLARAFGESCAEPHSDIDTLMRESAELYHKILLPIEPLIRGHKHLVIEPDGELGIVPFEALVDSHGTFLMDRFTISFSLGLHYLTMAAPWYGLTDRSRALVVGDPLAPGWVPLPDAREEAQEIASLFRSNRLLLGDEASYRSIARELRTADVFHFSGHAMVSANGVGLVLGDQALLDVEKLDASPFRNNKLVVLSACSSADGATGLFDDRDSLARLLVGGGVPEVVASRWMVDSRATAALMKSFYGHLLRGKSVSEALARGIVELRAQPDFSHPFYWASFAVFGRG
jgi:CHAT domain-containing protein